MALTNERPSDAEQCTMQVTCLEGELSDATLPVARLLLRLLVTLLLPLQLSLQLENLSTTDMVRLMFHRSAHAAMLTLASNLPTLFLPPRISSPSASDRRDTNS